MKKLLKNLRILSLILPLALTACGDGWEVVYTKDVMPYGNDRTAGVGVVYVRKVLMPVKTLSLKPLKIENVIEKNDKAAKSKSQFFEAGTLVPKIDANNRLQRAFDKRLEKSFIKKLSK